MGSPSDAHGTNGRPLLLLDVDGVLQPVGRSLPRGFERFTSDEADVVLCRQHGVWLNQLAVRFDLVWATTWGATANQAIGSRLGLPELPHIDLGVLPRSGTRKLGVVKAFVGTRAVAWVDDELYEDAVAWAMERHAATLIRRTSGSVGLTSDDVHALEMFAAAL
jgi:hypothetical protein